MFREFLLSIFGLPLLISSCDSIDYDDAPAGEFSGSLFVMWVDEGGLLGDGKFVYVPNPNAQLTFMRKDGLPYNEIRPEMMYTDGGSIPKPAQLFKGFSPWGYAPAYMIHDWLFVARHCNLDGTPTPAERKMAGMDLQSSASIIAEAIKTLVTTDHVSANDVAPRVISSTVAGGISRSIWNQEDACAASRVSDEDRLAAEAGIPGSSMPAIAPERTLPDGTLVPLKAGRVVAEVIF